jgi:transcriptional regulator with XRE-family HTH domain
MKLMGTKQRAADAGAERARSISIDLGNELRRARQQHGLSQTVVGRAAGLSPSQVSRIERAQTKYLSIRQAARLLSVVGLELSARAYPAGPPIRDAAHLALLDRFRARIGPGVLWRSEVPVGRPGDRRSWDTVIVVAGVRIAVEAETRPRDVQELQRRLASKHRDDPSISSVILLLSDTRHNRAVVRDHGEALRAGLPLPASAILAALGAGRDPVGSGIVLI